MSSEHVGGRCWCHEKQRGSKSRSAMDEYGKHLSACKWGSWSTKRHDDLTEVMAAWLTAAGNVVDTRRVTCQDVYPRKGEKNLRIIPDMFSRDQRGIILTYDTMITRADYQANRALFAADAGEKMKRDKYNKHINECIKEGNKSRRLNYKMLPLLFETFGAAGKTMLDLTRRVRKQYRAYVLDHDDPKAEQVFHSTWMNRISTSLQIGTANMIHNIAMGRRTRGRPAKDFHIMQSAGRPADTEQGEHDDESDNETDNERAMTNLDLDWNAHDRAF